MKIKILILSLFLLFSSSILAQEKIVKTNKNFFKSSLFNLHSIISQPLQQYYEYIFISRNDIAESQLLDLSYERLLAKNYILGIRYAYCNYYYNDIRRPYKMHKDGEYTNRNFNKYEISFGKYIRKKKKVFSLSLVGSKINGVSAIYRDFFGGFEKYMIEVEPINGVGLGICNNNKFEFWKHFFVNTDVSYNYYFNPKLGVLDAYFGIGVAF